MKPAVLFDLGEVLVHLDIARAIRRLGTLAGPGREAEVAAIPGSPLAVEYERGEHLTEAFLRELGRKLHRSDTTSDVLADAWCDLFDPWPEMEALAERVLDLGHPVHVLSNTDPLHFATLKARMPILGRATSLFLSYERGVRKPDPNYFRKFLARAGLAPEEALFVDDRAENVASARGIGLRAHRHDGRIDELRNFLRAGGVAL